RGTIKAVDGVSLDVAAGETLGLVGESGCGKSTLGNAILRIVGPTGGQILLGDVDMASLGETDLRAARRRVQMIFQDPYSSLDPRMTVGESIGEPLLVHGLARGPELRAQVGELLQRVALSPDLIVCDEPVSALDVSVRGQILNLLLELQRSLGTAYLFISHDLSVVRHISDRIAVMYLGRIVEIAARDPLFARPLHPYTQALISAIPLPDPPAQRRRSRIILKGEMPSPARPPAGCPFHTRCPIAKDICRVEVPPLEQKSSGA